MSAEVKSGTEFIGRCTKEKCPRAECHGFIFVNDRGNRWCSSINCTYHIHNGKQVEIKKDYDDDRRDQRRR